MQIAKVLLSYVSIYIYLTLFSEEILVSGDIELIQNVSLGATSFPLRQVLRVGVMSRNNKNYGAALVAIEDARKNGLLPDFDIK